MNTQLVKRERPPPSNANQIDYPASIKCDSKAATDCVASQKGLQPDIERNKYLNVQEDML